MRCQQETAKFRQMHGAGDTEGCRVFFRAGCNACFLVLAIHHVPARLSLQMQRKHQPLTKVVPFLYPQLCGFALRSFNATCVPAFWDDSFLSIYWPLQRANCAKRSLVVVILSVCELVAFCYLCHFTGGFISVAMRGFCDIRHLQRHSSSAKDLGRLCNLLNHGDRSLSTTYNAICASAMSARELHTELLIGVSSHISLNAPSFTMAFSASTWLRVRCEACAASPLLSFAISCSFSLPLWQLLNTCFEPLGVFALHLTRHTTYCMYACHILDPVAKIPSCSRL